MERLSVSNHARTRAQQRGVPSYVQSLLYDHGSWMRHDGADVYFVDKPARKRIRREVGGSRNFRTIEPWLNNTYLVVADSGAVITTARRTRRLKRP
jgi:hypothetical protein